MRTEDIIKQQETTEDKVSGLLVDAPGLVWGNLYGDIDSQKDLKRKFDHLEDDIKKLTPEGMITDVYYNGESIVDSEDHIAKLNIPFDELSSDVKFLDRRATMSESKISKNEANISNLDNKVDSTKSEILVKEAADVNELKASDTALGGRITSLEESIPVKLSALERKITTDIQPKIDAVKEEVEEQIQPKLDELSKVKASAMYRDEEGVLDPSGEGNKYWYLMDSNDFNSEDPEDLLLHVLKDTEGKPLPYDIGKGGGGGGTDTNVTISQVDWPTGISKGSSCFIKVNWSSLKDEIPTGPGNLQVYINGELKITRTAVKQGLVEFDITNYIIEDTSKVMVVVIDSYENSSRTVGYISQVDVRVESNFNADNILSNEVVYTYIPYGLVSKTVHFVVDGEEAGTDVVKTSGEQQTHRFNNWTHGHHTLKVYFTCVIADNEVRSNELYYDLIYNGGSSDPIIASTYTKAEEQQYNSFAINYRVYTPNHNESQVEFYIDDKLKNSLTVDQTTHYWESSQDELGVYAYKIKCGNTIRQFNIEITKNDIDVKPVEVDKVLELLTAGRSNSEAHPEIWKDEKNNISATLSNFNFSSDGWIQKEEDGALNTVLRVTGDARVEIPYKIFERDFKTLGKTIEIELATLDVLDYETLILSCFSGDRGITITPQLAKIKSQQSELQTQYKEEDHVRLAFVIEKNVENRLMLMYINGIMCGAVQYPDSDNFRQLTPVNISIGSNDATIDIYGIRVYDNNLNRKQVVNNWIADTQSGALKRERYLHNDNYSNDTGEIIISKLPTDIPYMVWDMDLLPQYKGDKRPGNVEYVDLLDDSRSFTSENATYNVQGTSSAGYPVKNIRIKYKQNKDWPDKIFTWLDSMGKEIKKFSITKEDGIGDNYFTYKVDFASSEGANNVELTKLYNDVSKVNNLLTPAQKEDSRVRVGIDGYPIVAFQRNADDTVSFVTKANFNNDKANEAVYGFTEGDESWETTNNSAAEALYKLPVTQETFGNSFEIRFPDVDGYDDLTRLKPMTEWVYSTYKELATNEPFDEPITYTYTNVVRSEDGSYSTIQKTETFEADTERYRLVKFKAELADHFNVRSTLFYYLFTHVFLMVDSRAKNAFPTYLKSRHPGDGGDRWFFIPYDMDTALGINNEGKLVFDYNLEDTDKVDGANVFNGQDSVLWCNLREMFDGEIGQLYAALRTNKDVEFSYEEVEKRFTDHQAKWSEAIFNEDSYNKYIVPLKSGDDYLEMLQGSKAEQRKWWLYNRFKYFDSKYLAGDAKLDFIQFRAYAKSDLTLTPYADIYATASFANGMVVSKRANRNKPITLENPLPESASDQETYIYSASQLKYIGDLSGFKPDTLKVANATRLQELKVGDASPDYENAHLTELTLGANKLLRKLDVRNCTNLKQTVNLTGCTNLEECYFDGTAITGLTLPNGGILKKLHLPSTITNLTIRNQKVLTDLTLAGTDNVQTLWLENIPSNLIDAKALITSMPTGGAVRLIGFKQNVSSVNEIKDLYNLLDTMTGLNAQGQDVPKAQVNGVIYIDTITYAEYAALLARYPDVQIAANHVVCKVLFYNDGSLYSTKTVDMGRDVELPEDPTKESDPQFDYTFVSWDKDLTNVQSDLQTDAIYESTLRSYEVKFDTQTTKVSVPSQVVYYGEKATRPSDPAIHGTEFKGWFKEASCINLYDFESLITGPLTLYAKWEDQEAPIVVDITRDSYKKFTFTIRDNIAVTQYAITKSEVIPDAWNDITPTEVYTSSYEIDSSGDFYIWGRDAAGLTAHASIKAYQVDKSQAVGSELNVSDGELLVDNCALEGTHLIVSVSLDEHYEDLVIKLNGAIIENEYEFDISEDVSIVSECSPKTYTVSFEIGEYGEPVEDQSIIYLHKAIQPQNQYVVGHVIDGWFKEEGLINRWNFEENVVEGDLTLYAKWVEYREPTKILINVTDNKTVRVNFMQTVSEGVKVDWDDSSEPSRSTAVGRVQLSHTYENSGEYEVKITCLEGDHLLGYNYSNQVIVPVEYIKNVEFAWNMSSTNMYALRAATGLTKIQLTDYMTETAMGAFQDCSNVTELVIPDNITSIGESSFNGCRGLTGTLTLSKYVKSIGSSAFENCSGVTYFDLPDTIEFVGNYAFRYCDGIETFDIPKLLVSLPAGMVAGCANLKEVEIPETVEIITNNTFTACPKLEHVVIKGKPSTGGQNFNNCPKLKTAGPIGGDYNLEYAWDESIPSYAFSCSYLQSYFESITLPSTLKVIENNAFDHCQRLTTIELPLGLKEIGAVAFRRNSEMLNLTIPESVESIGYNAFQQCTSLRHVYIRNANSIIKADIPSASWFLNCYGVTKLHVPSALLEDSDVRAAYGQCFNYYNSSAELTYYNDIES